MVIGGSMVGGIRGVVGGLERSRVPASVVLGPLFRMRILST